MTANDYGHINNLDKAQRSALKECWTELISAIKAQTSSSDKPILQSEYGNELFTWFADENPDVVLLRWLRAQKWDVKAAVQQIINFLRWRIKWGVRQLLAKGEGDISLNEAQLGKGYFMGQDKAGRPICYIHAKEHLRGQYPIETTEKLAVLALETARKLLQSPAETFTVVLDVGGISMKNVDLPLVKTFINLFQNNYPESLGLGLILNASWVFNSCWSIVKPWLDPAVEGKIRFIKKESELTKYIDPVNIPQRLHGKHSDFQYLLPTENDQAMVTALRNDQEGKITAETNHRQAATKYLRVTRRWAENEDNPNSDAERSKALENLYDAYEQLLPYITTRIHYHRTGDIHEPIFDIAYQRLRTTSDDDVVYF